jgi:hypothetical protein
MIPFVVPIVEGFGEIEAVPLLLRRIAAKVSLALVPRVNPPTRVKIGSFLNDQEYFTRYITLAAAKAKQADGLVLILLDCDDDCPATLGPVLLARALRVRSDVPYLVALAHREFEAWFIAALDSLREYAGFAPQVEKPANPESFRDAKGWLRAGRAAGYDPMIDQAAFTAVFDLDEASLAPSFARLRHRLDAFYRKLSLAAP